MTTKIEAMRDEYEATTPGPWTPYNMDSLYVSIRKGEAMRVCDVPYDLGPGYDVANAQFIVSAHNVTVPALLAVAEAAAKAWPRMVGLFEFAALHGITEPDPDIVAFRAAVAPLLEDAE